MKSTEILERIQNLRLLTSSAVDSLARTSALLEKVSELSVREAAYGLKCSELYGKLDLNTCSLKTAQCSLFGGVEQVLCDLSEIGYDAEWQCLSGTDFGIQQNRERLYCIAYPSEINGKRSTQESVFRKPYLSGQFTRVYPGWRTRQSIPSPRFAGKSNGVPDRMDRTECIGNAVQPIIAHYLFECIKIFDSKLT